jgi:hypothetical protein
MPSYFQSHQTGDAVMFLPKTMMQSATDNMLGLALHFKHECYLHHTPEVTFSYRP